MGAWLRSLWTDEARFRASLRSAIALVGTLIAANPDMLAGWGKYGGLLVAVSLAIRSSVPPKA